MTASPIPCAAIRRPAGLLLAGALVMALAGCAGGPPKSEPRLEGGTTAGVTVEETSQIDADVRADFEAALALLKEEKYERAIELLTRVTERLPTNTAPFINLAIAQQNIGRFEAAEENLKKALAIRPDHPVARNEYGILYRRTGRFAEARKAYEETLSKYPSFLAARKNLAILCDLYLKDYDCALTNYQLYGQAAPGDKNVEIWIADVKSRAGR